MKKKAVALAVGALFAAPAVQAQLTMGNETTGTVQVYGKLYPQLGPRQGARVPRSLAPKFRRWPSTSGVYSAASAATYRKAIPTTTSATRSTRRTPTSAFAASATSAAD